MRRVAAVGSRVRPGHILGAALVDVVIEDPRLAVARALVDRPVQVVIPAVAGLGLARGQRRLTHGALAEEALGREAHDVSRALERGDHTVLVHAAGPLSRRERIARLHAAVGPDPLTLDREVAEADEDPLVHRPLVQPALLLGVVHRHV